MNNDGDVYCNTCGYEKYCGCNNYNDPDTKKRQAEINELLGVTERLIGDISDLKKFEDKHSEKLEKRIKELKQQNKKMREVLEFYANPEKWIKRNEESWRTSNPREFGDDEMIMKYKHPNTDWVGTVRVGGKRARALLKELEG
jgi:uncharacterized Zn finger protein (UPF0148 family)